MKNRINTIKLEVSKVLVLENSWFQRTARIRRLCEWFAYFDVASDNACHLMFALADAPRVTESPFKPLQSAVDE